MCVSGRKFSVVGLSSPERSISVPDSATPPKARLSDDGVAAVGGSGQAFEMRLALPRQARKHEVGAVPNLHRKIVGAKISADRRRHIVRRGQPLGRGGDALRHLAEERDAALAVELAPRRDEVRLRLAESRAATAPFRVASSPDTPSARRTLPSTASRPLTPASPDL